MAGGIHPVSPQTDEHPPQTGAEQYIHRPVQACLVRDGHSGQELGLQPVGLQGVELAQHRPQLLRLGGGYRIGEDGQLDVVRQPGDGFRRNVGVHYNKLGVLQQLGPARQESGGDVVIDLHIAHRQGHVSLFIGDEQVSGGGRPRYREALTDVDAQLAAAGGDPLGVHVVPKGGEQPHVHPKQGHVVGNISPHTPQAHPHPAGVGVGGHQGLV